MRTIKISFVDFWPDFNLQNNFLVTSLKRNYNVEIVNPKNSPDFLFFSIFGYENLFYKDCIRIYYTGENDIPDFNKCDYAISFQHLNFGERHLRLPIYTRWPSFDTLRFSSRKPIPNSRGFCSYVVSNNWCATPLRTEIFEKLSAYKHIASGGRYANNIGGPIKDKIEFLRNYKFNIAFENSLVNGYTTEKLIDALAAHTIPIYWGNPDVAIDINPKSFINVNDFANIDECIEYIKRVDNDDVLYNQYLSENPIGRFHPFSNWEDLLSSFLCNIIENPHHYITSFGLGGTIFNSALEKEELYHSQALRKILQFYKKFKKNE